jgi:mannose-6-phosphate isomerase-like protein (cupin superfamily)
MSRDICVEFGLDMTGTSDPVDVLADHLEGTDPDSRARVLAFGKHLSQGVASRGYAHMAQLAAQGYVTHILTTNWDPLVEEALYRALPARDIKVLIRGEVTDDRIAESLITGAQRISVIKLHGDLAAGIFMLRPSETRDFSEALTTQLGVLLDGHCIMIGQSARDVDTLSILLKHKRGSLYQVRPDVDDSEIVGLLGRSGAKRIAGTVTSVLAPKQVVNIGEFDHFFTQLNLMLQQRAISESLPVLAQVERAILDKERSGLGYINYTAITEQVERFTTKVLRTEPDLIFFINDPDAPGGLELRRRMIDSLERVGSPIYDMEIKGEKSRSDRRAVHSARPALPPEEIGTVVILDAITFSGNTLSLARAKAQEWFPNAQIKTGVLVVSQSLLDRAKDENREAPVFYETITDRFEIFFPWGVTQLTADFDRRFIGADATNIRRVKVSRRPWGAIEILADEEISSVRLLTIEARDKLSFQRHLCRDELFVALDDNIGLDLCAANLDRETDQYDPRIKSIVLEKGDYILIPRGIWHRTKASMDRVRLLEVAFGIYDQAEDLERLWDDYDRAGNSGAE